MSILDPSFIIQAVLLLAVAVLAYYLIKLYRAGVPKERLADAAFTAMKSDFVTVRDALQPQPFPGVGATFVDLFDIGRQYEHAHSQQGVNIDGKPVQTGASPAIELQTVDGGFKRTA